MLEEVIVAELRRIADAVEKIERIANFTKAAGMLNSQEYEQANLRRENKK